MRLRTLALLAASIGILAGCGSSGKSAHAGSTSASGGSAPAGTHALTGTFRIDPGVCSSGTAVPTGSYLQMLGGGGAVVKNSFGGCANAAYTPLKPGSKGLVTGSYEPPPSDSIFLPANFFGSDFRVSTAPVDAQTNEAVPPPSIESNAGNLSGNLEAVDVAYNGAFFNQGAPKPGGAFSGATKALSGTISCDGSYTMQWQSQIVGGAFNNFTGVWHLTGTFIPSSGSVAHALGCS